MVGIGREFWSRRAFALAFVLMASIAGLGAQSAGTGISVFLPRSLLQGNGGSPAFEQSLGTELGLGSLLRIPFGIDYYQVDGMGIEFPSGDFVSAAAMPAFYGDSLQAYAGLGLRLGVGKVFMGIEGGGIGSWSFRLSAIDGALESALPAGSSISQLTLTKNFGYGWFAGAKFGVVFGKLSFDLGATWRDVRQPLGLDLKWIDYSSGTAVAKTTSSSATLVLQGLSCRLGGSFSF